MSNSNSDTYMYICNGAQHSSSHAMNHRFWFRERYDPTTNSIGTQANPGRTCKAIKTAMSTASNGIYWIDPESDGSPIQVQCEMNRQGGGWTLGLKAWHGAAVLGNTGAAGTVGDAMTLEGGNYKLSDNDIRDIIGPANKFAVMAVQVGHNTQHSTGNYEYTILSNYTGTWNFGVLMPESTTATSLAAYRVVDNANIWTGRLGCGDGSVDANARGIACSALISGPNPAGGAGCSVALGSVTNAGWHDWYMSNGNTDTYTYICNGAQHSSSHAMNHRFWFREG
jgi:hypothetical protein